MLRYLVFLLVVFIVSCSTQNQTPSPQISENIPSEAIEEKVPLVSQSLGLTLEQVDQSIPYFQIPDAPETYSAGAVFARTLDGLGYRYYWATHNLRETDLDYSPGNDGRTSRETMDHLYGLSLGLMHVANKTANPRPLVIPEGSFENLRKLTLQNIKNASDVFRTVDDVSDHSIIFQRGDNKSEFPVWNALNGFLADAIYHTGQIVSYRRSSGNPQHPGVSVFIGKTNL